MPFKVVTRSSTRESSTGSTTGGTSDSPARCSTSPDRNKRPNRGKAAAPADNGSEALSSGTSGGAAGASMARRLSTNPSICSMVARKPAAWLVENGRTPSASEAAAEAVCEHANRSKTASEAEMEGKAVSSAAVICRASHRTNTHRYSACEAEKPRAHIIASRAIITREACETSPDNGGSCHRSAWWGAEAACVITGISVSAGCRWSYNNLGPRGEDCGIIRKGGEGERERECEWRVSGESM